MIEMDPSDFIRTASPGTMIFARCERQEAIETCALARASSSDIQRQTTSYPFRMRAAVFQIGTILLLPVLLRVHSAERSPLYEAWINPGPEDGRVYVEDLARQSNLQIYFYGESGTVEKAVSIDNTLSPFFRGLLDKTSGGASRSREEYDYAMDIFCKRYSREVLWKLIGQVETTHRTVTNNQIILQ